MHSGSRATAFTDTVDEGDRTEVKSKLGWACKLYVGSYHALRAFRERAEVGLCLQFA